jgi:hypothetical protein
VVITEESLQEMQERTARGETLSPEESLELVQRVRKLEWDLSGMDSLYNTLCLQTEARREDANKIHGRLRYALRQLEKEARFKRREVPENSRFYRAYDTLAEVLGH